MYSSKDAANPAYPTQWALNPTAYQNVDSSQVDWAALAQQWIAMKEAAAIVAPPPPPSMKPDNEEGEAPMEVENPDNNSDGPPGAEWNAATNSWGDSWNQWSWGWSGPGPDPKVAPDTSLSMAPLIDGYPVGADSAAPIPGYTTGSAPTPTFQHGYWTAQQTDQSHSRSSSRSRERRSKSKTKDHKPTRSSRPPRDKAPVLPPVIEPIVVPSAMPTSMIDAAKRRQLPAWIREGLEKMEREKQRAIEREQEKKAREEAEREKKRLEDEELERIKAEASGQPIMPPKSKFESDSETEEMEDVKDEKIESSPVKEEPSEDSPKRRENNEVPLVKKSREEIMQEVMLAVRRSLTEILLEVTDQEIQTVSQEELVRYTTAQASRLNAMKASKSKALAAIATGLGLGAYESSSEESADEEEQKDVSDQQLQEIIKRKRFEFERTSREIEAAVRRAEQMEAAAFEDEPSTPEQPRRSRSSVTPPTVVNETPDKVSERRVSKDKRTPHRTSDKSVDRVDGLRRLDSIPEEKIRNSSYKDRTPSPNKLSNRVNHKDTSTSSSDSEDDSSSSSSESSATSDQEIKSDERQANKRKRERSSSNESRKRSKRDKSKRDKYKVEEKTPYTKSKHYDDYDKSEKSKLKKREEYYGRHKSSRDRNKGKYRDDSEDDRPKKRVKRSRSVSYESRSGRRRSSRDRRDKKSYERESTRRDRSRDKRSYDRESSRRDRSHDRSGRDYDKYDRYERYRDDRRRSRSGSHARHRR